MPRARSGGRGEYVACRFRRCGRDGNSGTERIKSVEGVKQVRNIILKYGSAYFCIDIKSHVNLKLKYFCNGNLYKIMI